MPSHTRSRASYRALWWIAAVTVIAGLILIVMRSVDVSVYISGVYDERIVDVLPHGFALAGIGAVVALLLLFLDSYIGRPFSPRERVDED